MLKYIGIVGLASTVAAGGTVGAMTAMGGTDEVTMSEVPVELLSVIDAPEAKPEQEPTEEPKQEPTQEPTQGPTPATSSGQGPDGNHFGEYHSPGDPGYDPSINVNTAVATAVNEVVIIHEAPSAPAAPAPAPTPPPAPSPSPTPPPPPVDPKASRDYWLANPPTNDYDAYDCDARYGHGDICWVNGPFNPEPEGT